MAVRGLGCPVRFTLTAGEKGDAPQAAALIEGLPAKVVWPIQPMTPITCGKRSPPRARLPSSQTTHHGRSNIRSTSTSMPSDISSNAVSASSSNSDAWQPVSKKPPEITALSSLSPPSFYGCDKCPHGLGYIPVSLVPELAMTRMAMAAFAGIAMLGLPAIL
jgi:hypothetical protein